MKLKVVAAEPRMFFPIVSWIIRLFQWTGYSHYAVVYNTFVIDSTVAGVVWKNVGDFSKKYKPIIFWDVEIPDDFDVFKWSATYSARPYPILQNIGAGLKYLQIIKHNPFGKDDRQLNCSELVAVLLRDAKQIDIGDSDQYDLVTLEKLLDKVGKRVSYT